MHCLNPTDKDTYIKPDSWSFLRINLDSCSSANHKYGIKIDSECHQNDWIKRMKYLDPTWQIKLGGSAEF